MLIRVKLYNPDAKVADLNKPLGENLPQYAWFSHDMTVCIQASNIIGRCAMLLKNGLTMHVEASADDLATEINTCYRGETKPAGH